VGEAIRKLYELKGLLDTFELEGVLIIVELELVPPSVIELTRGVSGTVVLRLMLKRVDLGVVD